MSGLDAISGARSFAGDSKKSTSPVCKAFIAVIWSGKYVQITLSTSANLPPAAADAGSLRGL